jgi:hypothetical protein
MGEISIPPPTPSAYGSEAKRMTLSENLNNSFGYARAFAGDVGRYIILLILGFIPIVNLILEGYGARIIKTTPEVSDSPKLERYGDMFIDGLKIAVAFVIYMIIPIICIAAGAGGIFAGMSGFGPSLVTGVFGLTGLSALLLVVGIVLAFILVIFSAMGVAHMLKTNHFGKAFAFGEIKQTIDRIGWGRYIAWLLVIFLISVVVGAVVGAIPVVGWIISLIVAPFLMAFYFRSVGIMYSEGAPTARASETPPPPSSAT